MKDRLLEFDYLRALAIILIVLGHSVYNSEKGFPLLLENLLRGGTAVFVFISGFFLHAVFAKRFDWQPFMIKKAQNVLIPFLWVSLFGLACKVLIWIFKDGKTVEQLPELIYHTVKHFYVLYPHWYIPFIFVVFALSPVYLAYLKLPWQSQVRLLIAFSVLAMFVHRPHGNSVIQSVVYYTPYYLLGMLYSQYREQFLRHQTTVFVVSCVLIVLTLITQTYIWPWVGNSHKPFFAYRGIDQQFIQKVGLCFVMLAFCQWLAEHYTLKWLKWIGAISFAIFFIHPLFTMLISVVIMPVFGWVKTPSSATYSLLISLMSFVVMMVGSIAVTWWVQKALPKHSRALIGA